MLHVFPSNEQKFGDTFLVNTSSFNERIKTTEILEWYDTLNFISEISVNRWPIPIVQYNSDNLVKHIKNYEFCNPYVKFIHSSVIKNVIDTNYTMSLWREKTRAIVSLSEGNAQSLIPRDAKNYITNEVYEYPYIKKHIKTIDAPQDIIFISYDELDADKNWKILKDKFPHAKRVHGIKGMDNAFKAGALASSTDWYYAVFAKTKIHKDFDFNFRPDRFQQPKHYIFHAKNTMNGLIYGHMGIILCNCKGILNTPKNFGIDYVMSYNVEVVPTLSAISSFNTSPYQTWRTAFRECAKLSQLNDESPSVEGEYRLAVWTTKATGKYASWCLKGANDGIAFYKKNANNSNELTKAFNWEWLRNYFVKFYGDIN